MFIGLEVAVGFAVGLGVSPGAKVGVGVFVAAGAAVFVGGGGGRGTDVGSEPQAAPTKAPIINPMTGRRNLLFIEHLRELLAQIVCLFHRLT